jgi:hypothetical protein
VPDIQLSGTGMWDLQLVASSGYRPDTPLPIQEHRFAIGCAKIKPNHLLAFSGARLQVLHGLKYAQHLQRPPSIQV